MSEIQPPVFSAETPSAIGSSSPQAPVISFKNWFGTLALQLIAPVYLIMLFVWAFGSDVNPSKKNFARASLLFYAILTVLYIIIGIIVVGAILSSLSSVDWENIKAQIEASQK